MGKTLYPGDEKIQENMSDMMTGKNTICARIYRGYTDSSNTEGTGSNREGLMTQLTWP